MENSIQDSKKQSPFPMIDKGGEFLLGSGEFKDVKIPF
jgi:hypothetical protein